MQVFLAGLSGLAGLVLVMAAVHGNGKNLYAGILTSEHMTVSGLQTDGSAYKPAGPSGGSSLPLGPTGPGNNGLVSV